MELTIDFLAQTLGHDPATIKGMFVEQAEGEEPKPLTGEAFTAKAAEWLKSEKERILEAGKGIGKRERMSQFETKLREKYGIQATQQGEALVDAIITAKTAELSQLQAELSELKSKPSGKKLDDLDPEQAKAFIANHPFFKERTDELSRLVQEREAAFEQFKTQVERQQVEGMVKTYAGNFLQTQYRPILPDVPEIAQNMVDLYHQTALMAAEWRQDAAGNPVPYDLKTKERVVDPNTYHEMTADQFLTALAKRFFVPHPVDPNKGAPGASSGQGQANGAPDWRKFNGDKGAIMTAILQEKDPDKQRALLKSAESYL